MKANKLLAKKFILLAMAFTVVLSGCSKAPSHETSLDNNSSVETSAIETNTNSPFETSNWKPIHDTISANDHSVAVKSDGTVVSSLAPEKDSNAGQCNVSGWTDIVAVSAGSYHTVGLKNDGTVVATTVTDSLYDWGQSEVSSWTDIVAVAAGGAHTVGLKRDGTVVATVPDKGFDNGQSNVSNWKDIVAISASDHTVGLKSDGTVIATGSNSWGQCEVSDWTDIIAVSAGAFHTVGLKSDGTVVATKIAEFDDTNVDSGQSEVSGWTDIIAVSAGVWHTVGLKSDGTVVATGGEDMVLTAGAVTVSTNHGQSEVHDWKDIVAISAGSGYTLGIKNDGTVIATEFIPTQNERTAKPGQQGLADWKDIKLPESYLDITNNTDHNMSNSSATSSQSSNHAQSNDTSSNKQNASSSTTVNSGNTSNSSNIEDNTEKDPCANGHKWVEATCSSPETCSVCGKTSGQPLGHDLYITKCTRCDYTDFSRLAKSYSDEAVTAYDSKTGEDYTVTNVKLSNSGIFSFNFNGKQYALSVVQTDKQEGTSGLVVFDCYIDGKIEPDATFYIAPDYLNPRLEWEHLDGCNLYIYVDV